MTDWEDDLSPEEQKEWESFVKHTREVTVEGIAKSAFVLSFPPSEDGPDMKLAIETGLAILLDKPIVALAVGGQEIPSGLRRVAHAVIEVDDIDTETGRAELAQKLEPILKEFGLLKE